MLIDPFTVIVQIINFAILLVALKFLLFDRIVKHMDERQERLAEQREQADERLAEATDRGRELDRRLAEIEREREERLAQAREEARQQRQELIEEARSEVEERRDRWSQALEDEKDQMMARIRATIGEQVMGLTRRTLADLADVPLQTRLLDTFERRIDELEPDERSQLREWISGDGKPSVVSTIELDDAERRRLDQLVAELAGQEVELEYRADDSLIGGLEIQAGGHAFGWTIDGYLDQVDESLRDAIGQGRAGGEVAETAEDEPEDEPHAAPGNEPGDKAREGAGASAG